MGGRWAGGTPSTRIPSALVTAWTRRHSAPLTAAFAITAGAILLRLIYGVAFANYDTLYALAWGGQLAQGETPAYGVPIAPTPHPLLEIAGVILRPLSPHLEIELVVALAFLALATCAWLIYELGARWFGRAAGALAAVVFLTRVPVISDGVRAYLDIPYLTFVLGALLLVSRRPSTGAPVLGLLALAGLLRPEAWVFSGLYWLYLMGLLPARLRALLPPGAPIRERGRVLRLTLLAAAAPLIWLGSDLAITGNPLWSLTNTRHTASTLDRKTGIGNVPLYVPKRIGEVLQAAGAGRGCDRRCAVAALAAEAGAARRARGRRGSGDLRRLRGHRSADQHPLRLPGSSLPVHLLRRRGVRLAGTAGG